jgi:hypothetical protein
VSLCERKGHGMKRTGPRPKAKGRLPKPPRRRS